MRVIAKRQLSEYWDKPPEAEQPLKAWHDEAIKATWKTPQDIKAQYSSASILAGNRVVFNIKGNHHRLIVSVAYQYGALYIKFIGTHAEYDRINAATVELE
ncbi:MAG TPA: type II toxin-antitoxin system HigB family toxin [Burkholderiaceae bacterium]|jgi:mRNA interferase HigB|nr:type II toxin-antitoxin system HigB family toxin [Burkholderiaceae bacterium]